MKISELSQGLKRAERQIAESASRIARWGIQTTDELGEGDPLQADTVQIDGVARPRLFGTRPSRTISITDEAIQLKRSEFAYRANLSSIGSVLDMQDAILDMADSAQNKDNSDD